MSRARRRLTARQILQKILQDDCRKPTPELKPDTKAIRDAMKAQRQAHTVPCRHITQRHD